MQDITKLFAQSAELIMQIETYYQLAGLVAIFVVSYLLSRLVRSAITAIYETGHEVTYSYEWFLHRSGRLVFPVIAVLILEAIDLFSGQISSTLYLFDAVERVTLIWTLWVMLDAFINNNIVRIVGAWVLVPAALLRLFGLLEPVITRLNSYGFVIGDVNITPYLIIKAISLVVILVWLGRMISRSLKGCIRKNEDISITTQELIIKIFDIFLLISFVMIALNIAGIDLTALAVFSGAFGVGLGIGLQKIASNFVSGIILLIEKSVKINNLVIMDDGTFGHVRKLGARASVIEAVDGREVMVPNEDFITSRVSNLTYSNNAIRVDIPVGVSYDTDLRFAYDLILQAAKGYEHASTKAGRLPACYLREYGDSSVNFMLTFWVDDVNVIGKWSAQSDVMFIIWDSFKKNNIEIPFPQRDVHLRTAPENLLVKN
ncbi:MAG: mechanosensitive ion channel domain-containing protein [Pseudomonadota bacterium]